MEKRPRSGCSPEANGVRKAPRLGHPYTATSSMRSPASRLNGVDATSRPDQNETPVRSPGNGDIESFGMALEKFVNATVRLSQSTQHLDVTRKHLDDMLPRLGDFPSRCAQESSRLKLAENEYSTAESAHRAASQSLISAQQANFFSHSEYEARLARMESKTSELRQENQELRERMDRMDRVESDNHGLKKENHELRGRMDEYESFMEKFKADLEKTNDNVERARRTQDKDFDRIENNEKSVRRAEIEASRQKKQISEHAERLVDIDEKWLDQSRLLNSLQADLKKQSDKVTKLDHAVFGESGNEEPGKRGLVEDVKTMRSENDLVVQSLETMDTQIDATSSRQERMDKDMRAEISNFEGVDDLKRQVAALVGGAASPRIEETVSKAENFGAQMASTQRTIHQLFEMYDTQVDIISKQQHRLDTLTTDEMVQGMMNQFQMIYPVNMLKTLTDRHEQFTQIMGREVQYLKGITEILGQDIQALKGTTARLDRNMIPEISSTAPDSQIQEAITKLQSRLDSLEISNMTIHSFAKENRESMGKVQRDVDGLKLKTAQDEARLRFRVDEIEEHLD